MRREEGRGGEKSGPIRKVQTTLVHCRFILFSHLQRFLNRRCLSTLFRRPVPSLPFARHSPSSAGICRKLKLCSAISKPGALQPPSHKRKLVRCIPHTLHASLRTPSQTIQFRSSQTSQDGNSTQLGQCAQQFLLRPTIRLALYKIVLGSENI